MGMETVHEPDAPPEDLWILSGSGILRGLVRAKLAYWDARGRELSELNAKPR